MGPTATRSASPTRDSTRTDCRTTAGRPRPSPSCRAAPPSTPAATPLAVDAQGNPLTTDQRGPGFPRIVNGTVDIGAYEFENSVATVAVGWGNQSVALQTAGDGLRLLPAGRTTDLPWLGISQVQITLAVPGSLAPGDVSVMSASGINYGPVTVSGSGTSYTITLARPIDQADRVTITIGNATIATFTRRLDVLPGDINDDGVVNAQDLALVRNQWLGVNGTKPTIFGDINGDGAVNINDYNAVRAAIATSLPAVSESMAVASASSGTGNGGGGAGAVDVAIATAAPPAPIAMPAPMTAATAAAVSIGPTSPPVPIAMPAPTIAATSSQAPIGTTSQPPPSTTSAVSPAFNPRGPRHEIRLAARGRHRGLGKPARFDGVHLSRHERR